LKINYLQTLKQGGFMKKVLLILLAIIIGINLNTKAHNFYAEHNGKTIYYNITSSTSPLTVAVTYRGSTYNSFTNEYSGNVSIPDSVLYNGNSYKVTSIDEYAVYNCPNLTSISIPSSITSIGSYAFYNCSGLTSTSIPDCVTSIGDNAFYNCSGLTSITIPNSVTSIGNGVFKNCSGLTSLSIPNSITVIGNECFFGCIGLTSITIPDSITSFGFNAFYNCYGLTSISIPNTVTSIGYGAFSNCSGLTSITIPDSITSIGNATFKNCSGLTSLIIPSSVSSIGTEAFYGCSGLFSIIIPDLVTSIAAYSFYGCTGLTSITIPDSVTSIDFAAFQNCSGLTSITIPNSIISIYGFAFKNCNSLNTLYFNALNCSLLGEGYYPAFDNSNNLSSIFIGDSVIDIPNYAFSYCTGLTSITISNSLTSIGKNAFYNCFSLTSIRIPNSVTSIGNGAFENCSALTSVTIPNSVTSIGVGAFQNCSALTSIILPNSITSIENSTFSNCTNLKSIIIPSSVTLIHNSAFYNCIFLSSIICQAIIPPTINNFSFGNVQKYIPLYVPCNSFSSYDSALYWSDFTNIVGIRAFQLIDTSICKGQTYTSNGFNNNLTGLYSQNLNTINGCDSLIILNLFVNPTYNDTILAEICFGDTYTLNGFNVNTTGLYTQNLQSIKGCDSIVNLSLIVNPIYNDTIFAEICHGETYNQYGFNENATGFYTQNLQTIKGCDSIVNLSLIVNPIYDDTIFAVICSGDTYSQNGFNETSIGFYTQNLQTISGCDSVVNLTLTVNQPAIINLTAEICQGETYTLNGFNVSTDGLYTQNLQTYKGCDSIVNLNLIVNPTSIVYYFDTICKGNEYNSYGFSFTADTTGRYTQNLQTINGCDSVFVLNLVVNPTPYIPSDLSVQVMTNYIEITWQSNGNSYAIYRNDSLIANVTQPIYLDYNVVNGQPYCYKVKAINGDCESEFSNVVCKSFLGLNEISSSDFTAKLYPNPTNNKSKLKVEGLKSDADIIVSDLLGRVIKSYKINPTNNELEIDVNGFAKGVYNIRIMNDSINQTKKLIVQ